MKSIWIDSGACLGGPIFCCRKCTSTRRRFRVWSIRYPARLRTISSLGRPRRRPTATSAKAFCGASPARESAAQSAESSAMKSAKIYSTPTAFRVSLVVVDHPFVSSAGLRGAANGERRRTLIDLFVHKCGEEWAAAGLVAVPTRNWFTIRTIPQALTCAGIPPIPHQQVLSVSVPPLSIQLSIILPSSWVWFCRPFLFFVRGCWKEFQTWCRRQDANHHHGNEGKDENAGAEQAGNLWTHPVLWLAFFSFSFILFEQG